VAYAPFSGSGPAPGLKVALHQSGPCYVYGGGAEGRLLYRCFAQQQVDGHSFIWDPCFAGPDGTAAPLLCPDGPPTSDRLVAFTVTGISGTAPPATTRTVWAIELADGQVCDLVAAAWGGLGPFQCQPPAGSPTTGSSSAVGTASAEPGASAPSGALADCHEPVSGQPWWSASCQADESEASPFVAQRVVTVWF
jgi:hypothetical protein